MYDNYSRATSRSRARKRFERIVRRISLITIVAILAVVGAFVWRQRLLDREGRASASWHSVKETPRSESNDLDIVVPPAQESTAAAAPRSIGPSLRRRSGVASLFFGERELVPIDVNGKRVLKQEELFVREISIPTGVNVSSVKQ